MAAPRQYGNIFYHRNHSLWLQESLEELLVQHRVDLVLAGHEHAYLRTGRIQGLP